MSAYLQYGVPLAVVPLLMVFKYGKPRGYLRDLFSLVHETPSLLRLARDRQMQNSYMREEQ